FRLFVVLVAVDARWLLSSLETRYDTFFGANGAHPSAPKRDNGGILKATPADYLEKIFQIPYWVPRMGPDASKRGVRGLVARDQIMDPSAPAKTERHDDNEVQPMQQPAQPQTSKAISEDDQSETRTPPVRALGLTKGEIEALEALAPFVGGSPRRAR